MSDGLNKVMLIGNLGQDPEVRFTQGGNAVMNLRMVTNESWYDKESGERKEKSEWHTCVLWGKRAESLSKHLTKGQKIYVEGSLQTRSWEDKEGNKRYTTEVNLKELLFLSSKGERSEDPPEESAPWS